ncbi:acyltransferase family protein [Paraburkholderia sp. BCC1885]|uniref:acyltransferase family protein n=1 Tax=Paraburkholderia sp. BCC1885 TaxID=2562669 RepID=UPI0011841B3C|nr:acyltransferase [Paraburkholderia sp. BCC1885]
MKHRAQELTGLRAIAVAMVVVGHAQRLFAGGYTGLLRPLRLVSDGRLGVLVFFVLSGFLITSILQAELKSTGRIRLLPFYVKRALRIWPAFYTYLAAVVVLTLIGWTDVDGRQFMFAALHLWNYSGLGGMSTINTLHADGAWYLGHFWTLALEEQFYWLWPPLLFYIWRRNSQLVLVLLIFLVPLIRVATYFAAPQLRGQLSMMFHTGIDPILIGCFVALNKERIDAWIRSWPGGTRIPTAIVLALFVLMPLAEARLGGFWNATYGTTLEAALVGIVIVVLYFQSDFWCSRLLRTAPFVFLGTISFSLYLWQQLFANVNLPIPHAFPLGILEAVGAATASYYFVEAPFLRLKDRLANRMKRSPASEPVLLTPVSDGIGPEVLE